MAWREARSGRSHFVPYCFALILALYALSLSTSLNRLFESELDAQARALLGADIAIESRDGDISPSLVQDYETRRELSFRSMLSFEQGSRLAQIRAVEEGFPFYGSFKVDPEGAVLELHRKGGVILDDSIIRRFGLTVGSRITLGNTSLVLRGALQGLPGESPAFSGFLPRALIRYGDVVGTGLLDFGSVIDYKTYIKLPPAALPAEIVNNLKTRLGPASAEIRTVSDRKAMLSDIFENVSLFFELISLSLLILIGIAVGSSVRFYLAQHRQSIAVLRCIGTPTSLIMRTYVLQLSALALIASVVAIVASASTLQFALLALKPYLPIVIKDTVPFVQIVSGVAEIAFLSLTATVILPLPLLLKISEISPLEIFRPAINEAFEKRSLSQRIAWLVIAVGIFGYIFFKTQHLKKTLVYSAGLVALVFLFWAISAGMRRVARRAMASSLPYSIRLGLSNLHRPGNNTGTLLASLGIGTFVILTVLTSDATIRTRANFLREQNKPNYVLFDVQQNQVAGVRSLLDESGFQILQEAPVVLMRLKSVNGRTTAELEESGATPRWTLRREYWTTYRDRLIENEKVLTGEFVPRVSASDAAIVPVSIERSLAEKLGASLGAELVFSVHGREIKTSVASIREVYWQQMKRNAYIVFPDGVLNKAPQFTVMMTRVENPEDIARLEQGLSRNFPNISGLDLRVVVATVQELLDSVSTALVVLAGVVLITGMLVLASSLLASRYQRSREQALLRTLGGSDSALYGTFLSEQFALVLIALISGTLLATGVAIYLAAKVFKSTLDVPVINVVCALGLIVSTVILIGLATTRSTSRKSPLEILRTE